MEWNTMNRFLIGLGAAAATLALPAAASAYTAYATANVNLRACGSTQCGALTVIPGGAAVNVRGTSGGWSTVTYGGITGYASAGYFSTRYAQARPPVVVRRAPVYPPVVAAYPAYPVYPGYSYYPYRTQRYMQPGFSLSFRFGG
jgi:uncharacterized protein YraI